MGATLNADIGATSFPANVDSVSAGTTLEGQRSWGFQIGSDSGSPITNPTISIASGYTPSLLEPEFGSPATSLPVVFSGPEVLDTNGGVGMGSSIDATFQTRCDTSRSVSPLIVPVGGGQQTLTYTFSCTGVDSVGLGVALGLPGASVVSSTPPSGLDVSATLNLPAEGGVAFGLGNVQSGTQYTGSFVLQVPNPFGSHSRISLT